MKVIDFRCEPGSLVRHQNGAWYTVLARQFQDPGEPQVLLKSKGWVPLAETSGVAY